MINTISSSGPPTSFQFVILAVKISVNCCFVKDFTVAAISLFTTGAIVTTQTLWSTKPSATALSSFVSATTSELPISTEPSATCLRPVPDPPPFNVIETSGCNSLNLSAASLAKGNNAEEPDPVILPERLLEDAALSLEAVSLPQPKILRDIIATTPRDANFFQFIIP